MTYITSSDALPLSYRRLARAKAIKQDTSQLNLKDPFLK